MAGSLYNFLPPPTSTYAEHAQWLYGQRDSAVHVPRKSIFQDGWFPLPNRCHQNCSEWTELNPDDQIVKGWLCFDMSAVGFYRFASHSVIQTKQNQLIDITPTTAVNVQLFLKDALEDSIYEECISKLFAVHGFTFLDYLINGK